MKNLFDNFLNIPINKRFVDSIEYLATQSDAPVTRRQILERIGLSETTYNTIKKGARGLPEKYYRKAALILSGYGISVNWFNHGIGEMRKPPVLTDEISFIIDTLHEELRVKEAFITKILAENKRLKQELAGKE